MMMNSHFCVEIRVKWISTIRFETKRKEYKWEHDNSCNDIHNCQIICYKMMEVIRELIYLLQDMLRSTKVIPWGHSDESINRQIWLFLEQKEYHQGLHWNLESVWCTGIRILSSSIPAWIDSRHHWLVEIIAPSAFKISWTVLSILLVIRPL